MDIRELSPSDISFSVAVVDNRFHKNSKHGYCPIGETLDSLCVGEIKISDIPKISVLKRGTEWITINNRRLWIFRQMERLGKCMTIQVLVTEEITLPHECDAFMNADVREDPGGLCYLLPACQKKDPVNNIIWGTFKHIKENMFPPPNRRMIITIFHNLLNENQREEGNSSKGRTLSSGYLEIRMGGFNVTQIDMMQKKMRTHQWIFDHHVSKNIFKYDRSIKTLTIELLPRNLRLPKFFHSVPGGSLRCDANIEIDRLSNISRLSDISRLSVTSTISQQGSLPDDTSKGVKPLSAASCQISGSSGYLIVTGTKDEIWDNEQSVSSGEFMSEDIETKRADKHKANENLHRIRPKQSNIAHSKQANLKEITSDIIYGIEGMLSQETQQQCEFSKQIPDIHVLIETRIKRAFDIYESEIEALKSDIDSLLQNKNEDIHNPRQEANRAIRNLQELQMNQTKVQGPSSGVDANTKISDVCNCHKEDINSNRVLEIRGKPCSCGISILESKCPSVNNRRRRNDSDQTITEATVGEAVERDVVRQENYYNGLDADLHIE